jgi:general secretion pathway protein G
VLRRGGKVTVTHCIGDIIEKMFSSITKKQRGFTLIEILVVVAIIGVLTSILIVNYNQARENSRDKIRKSDLKALQLAVELYKSQKGSYPTMGCSRNTWTGITASFGSCPVYITGLVPDYIGVLPTDPGNVGDGYIYYSDGASYKILSHNSVETALVSSYDDEFARCPRDCDVSFCDASPSSITYAVYSLGAECW